MCLGAAEAARCDEGCGARGGRRRRRRRRGWADLINKVMTFSHSMRSKEESEPGNFASVNWGKRRGRGRGRVGCGISRSDCVQGWGKLFIALLSNGREELLGNQQLRDRKLIFQVPI